MVGVRVDTEPGYDIDTIVVAVSVRVGGREGVK